MAKTEKTVHLVAVVKDEAFVKSKKNRRRMTLLEDENPPYKEVRVRREKEEGSK